MFQRRESNSHPVGPDPESGVYTNFTTPEQLYSDRIELICMYIGHDEPNLFLEGAVTI